MKSLIVVASLALSACATTETLVPVGGSRSDGVVKLAYQYGMFQKPVVNYDAAIHTATARCAAWGYSNAEAFGSSESSCVAVNGYGSCIAWRVTVAYQCTTPRAPQ
ncbi:MAG: YecR family lipoprotein [Steroidobacteraceae bacterium]